jgi:hypothetical protein
VKCGCETPGPGYEWSCEVVVECVCSCHTAKKRVKYHTLVFSNAEVETLLEACRRAERMTDDNGPVEANPPEVARFHDAVKELLKRLEKEHIS